MQCACNEFEVCLICVVCVCVLRGPSAWAGGVRAARSEAVGGGKTIHQEITLNLFRQSSIGQTAWQCGVANISFPLPSFIAPNAIGQQVSRCSAATAVDMLSASHTVRSMAEHGVGVQAAVQDKTDSSVGDVTAAAPSRSLLLRGAPSPPACRVTSRTVEATLMICMRCCVDVCR